MVRKEDIGVKWCLETTQVPERRWLDKETRVYIHNGMYPSWSRNNISQFAPTCTDTGEYIIEWTETKGEWQTQNYNTHKCDINNQSMVQWKHKINGNCGLFFIGISGNIFGGGTGARIRQSTGEFRVGMYYT